MGSGAPLPVVNAARLVEVPDPIDRSLHRILWGRAPPAADLALRRPPPPGYKPKPGAKRKARAAATATAAATPADLLVPPQPTSRLLPPVPPHVRDQNIRAPGDACFLLGRLDGPFDDIIWTSSLGWVHRNDDCLDAPEDAAARAAFAGHPPYVLEALPSLDHAGLAAVLATEVPDDHKEVHPGLILVLNTTIDEKNTLLEISMRWPLEYDTTLPPALAQPRDLMPYMLGRVVTTAESLLVRSNTWPWSLSVHTQRRVRGHRPCRGFTLAMLIQLAVHHEARLRPMLCIPSGSILKLMHISRGVVDCHWSDALDVQRSHAQSGA